MYGDLKVLMDAAHKFVGDTINDQIEQAMLEIAAQQRKIKRLRAQRNLFAKVAKELRKTPKPFKVPKISKAQRKKLEKMQQRMSPRPMMAPAVGL